MNERLNFQGRLAGTKMEKKRLGFKIKGLISSLREMLDPFETIEDLAVNAITELSIELGACHIEYVAAAKEIREIEKVLGRDQRRGSDGQRF